VYISYSSHNHQSSVKHAEAEPPRFTLSPPLKELLSDDAAAEQPRFVERV